MVPIASTLTKFKNIKISLRLLTIDEIVDYLIMFNIYLFSTNNDPLCEISGKNSGSTFSFREIDCSVTKTPRQ